MKIMQHQIEIYIYIDEIIIKFKALVSVML